MNDIEHSSLQVGLDGMGWISPGGPRYRAPTVLIIFQFPYSGSQNLGNVVAL